MVLMCHRCPEEGHDAITRKLVDGALIPVDLIHEDLETPIHDLMDLFGI